MLYIRLTANRTLIINEYWILIPLVIGIDYLIITQVENYRSRKKQNKKEKNKKKIKNCRQLKIYHLALSSFPVGPIIIGCLVNLFIVEAYKKGYHFLNQESFAFESKNPLSDKISYTSDGTAVVAFPKCVVGHGLRYLDNERFRKIIHALYHSKARNGVIFITKTALCYLIDVYGGFGLPIAFPVPVTVTKEVLRFSDKTVAIKKALSILALGIPIPIITLSTGPVWFVISMVAGVFGLLIAYSTREPDFLLIPTTLISNAPLAEIIDSLSRGMPVISRRMPAVPDVVTVNLTPAADFKPNLGGKIQMAGIEKPKTPYECLLPEQRFANGRCILPPSKITDIVTNADLTDLNLGYNDVVNMNDVTKLDFEFSDRLDIGLKDENLELFGKVKEIQEEFQKSIPSRGLRGVAKVNPEVAKPGKTVNFLDKFKDPDIIPEHEGWDAPITDTCSPDSLKISIRS